MYRSRFFLPAAGLALVSILLCGLQAAPAGQTGRVFKTEVRLVEVYATVQDRSGNHIEGLSPEEFEIRDNGELQKITAFESVTSDLSCAILLDASGSMNESLTIVKHAVINLIDRLRENDRIAVYAFNNALTRLQDLTGDKAAAKRAVLRMRAGGSTALFDALAEIVRDLADRNGKKSIVVFTDGADNSSFLYPAAALEGARAAGIPIYTIAQGEALKKRALLEQLQDISALTGASAHKARGAREIESVFEKIRQDLSHTYLLAYPAPASQGVQWRTITLTVKGNQDVRIRAKQGYYSN